MKQKYTIVIDPELHDWFAHRAIDEKTNISALIKDAMNTYRLARAPKKSSSSSEVSNLGTSVSVDNIPENKPKKYTKDIYITNTTDLNNTPRARRISKIARKAILALKKAAEKGILAKDLQVLLLGDGCDFQTYRETMTYLRDNKIAERRRDSWVHSDFSRRSNGQPQLSANHRAVRG